METGSSVTTGQIELVQDALSGDLWTGPVPAIRGSRFDPLTEIHVEVSCQDGRGRRWLSRNEYLVSAEGTFDTSMTAAVGEGYYGIAPEGPFYSMLCQDGPGYEFAWKELSAIDYRIAAYDGKRELFSRELRRVVGRSPEQNPRPSARVILFDDGSPAATERAAQALASHGVEVSTADPRHSSQPAAHDELPTVIVGSGRASARALEVAIRWPHAQAVVLFSGGGLRFDPFDDGQFDPDTGEWVSRPLDHIPLDHSSLQPKAEGILITRKLYAEAVAAKAHRERGRIEVEKVACPLYMFSGLEDQIWPASAFSELIAQRRKIQGCPYPTYHRTFEGVGHDLGPTLGLPTLPTTERTAEHSETGFRLLLGGKPGRQARARRECWDALLSILAI